MPVPEPLMPVQLMHVREIAVLVNGPLPAGAAAAALGQSLVQATLRHLLQPNDWDARWACPVCQGTIPFAAHRTPERRARDAARRALLSLLPYRSAYGERLIAKLAAAATGRDD